MADPEGFTPDPDGFSPDAAGFTPDPPPSAFQRGIQAAESPFKAAYGAMQGALGLGRQLWQPIGRVAAIPIPGVDAAAQAVQSVEGPAVQAVSGVLPWMRAFPPSAVVRSFDTVGGAALNLAPEALGAGARALAPAAEAAEEPVDLFLSRHGTTWHNVNGYTRGWDNPELTKEGEQVAQSLADKFKGTNLSAIYSSDLTRAQQTAQAVSDVTGTPVTPTSGLRPINYGELNGSEISKIQPQLDALDKTWRTDPYAPAPGGEGIGQMQDRNLATVKMALGQAQPGQDIGIVGHLRTMKLLRAVAENGGEPLSGDALSLMDKYEPKPGDVYHFQYQPSTGKLTFAGEGIPDSARTGPSAAVTQTAAYAVDPDRIVEAMDNAARERVPVSALLTPREAEVAAQVGDKLTFARRMNVPYESVLSPEERAMLTPTPPEPMASASSPLPPGTPAQPPPAGQAPSPRGGGPGLPPRPAPPIPPGTPTVNLANYSAEARPVIEQLAQSPLYGNAVVSEGGGVIPQAQTRAAAAGLIDRMGLTPDALTAAGTRQLPDINAPVEVQIEAARQLGDKAALDFQNAYKGWKSGQLPQEAVEAQAIRAFQANVSFQGTRSGLGRGFAMLNAMTPAERATYTATKVALQTGLEDMSRTNPGKFAEFMDMLARIPSDARAQRQALMMRTLGDSSLASKIGSIRSLLLTTNPFALSRIGTSTAINVAARPVERAIAGGIDALMSAATGSQRTTYAREALPMVYGTIRGVPQAIADAWDALRGLRPDEFAAPGQTSSGWQRFILRTHDAIRSAGYAMAGQAEAEAQAYRRAAQEVGEGAQNFGDRVRYWLQNPDMAMQKRIIDGMREATLMQPLGEVTGAISRAADRNPVIGPLMRFEIPFRRIPVNDAKMILSHVPGSAITSIGSGQEQLAQAMAKNASGLAAMFATWAAGKYLGLSYDGSGPPITDKKARQDWLAAGHSPYSWGVAGGMRHPLSTYGPLGNVMGAVADYLDYRKANPGSGQTPAIGQALQGLATNFLHTPFIQSAGDLIDLMRDHDGRSWASFARQQASSIVPPVVTLAKNYGVPGGLVAPDRTVRAPSTTAQAIQARVPGLSQNVPPKLDRFGAPIQTQKVAYGLLDNPRTDPLQKALLDYKLSDMVPMAPRELFGRKLDQVGQNDAIQASGPMMRRGLSALVLDPRFASLSDDDKRTLVKSAVQEVHKAAAPGVQLAGVRNELRALGIPAQSLSPAALGAMPELMADPGWKNLGDDQRRGIVNRVVMMGAAR